MEAILGLDRRALDRARVSRDARFDGRFFIAVTSTGIYCRPVCPSPTSNSRNVRYYATAAAAAEAGFRPCLRCRPEAAPGTPAWLGTSAVVRRALRLIHDGALDEGSVDELASRVGVGPRHLHRLFVQHVGASPITVAQIRRLHFAKRLVDETDLPLTEVALAAGFGSVRRFNDAFRSTYRRSPRELRQQRRGGAFVENRDEVVLRLSYRPPYDWQHVRDFLATRALPGVERVDSRGYARTVATESGHALVCVRPLEGRSELELRVRGAAPTELFQISSAARRMFDLAADPARIALALRSDAMLAPLVKARPGLRIPGAWDAFECAVRAVLGQQVSVAAGRTLAMRVVARAGRPLAGGSEGLTHLFPSAAALAQADLEGVGLTKRRALALRTLARAVADGSLDLRGNVEDVTAALARLPGIGDWTAQYVALRALGEPDAFLRDDLVLRRAASADEDEPLAARELGARAEGWRPWRGYAVLHLWRSAVGSRALAVVAALACGVLAGCGHDAGVSRERAATIAPAALRAHLEFLADDLLEGREAGTRGYDIAAAYVVSQFTQIGLEPAGARGYRQPVPLRRAVLLPASVSLTVAGAASKRTFTDADHVAARPSAVEPDQRVEARCVFAGYGIVSPEHGRDDYAGLEVRDRFVVLLGGPPPDLPSEIAAHLGSTEEQRARAAERGAAGVLIVYTPALQERFAFERLPPVYRQPQFEWLDAAVESPPESKLRGYALVDATAAAALFAGAERSLTDVLEDAKTRAPRGFPLATTATLARKATHSDASSDNVLGMLPGSDPKLAAEVIVFTSHLDHVGIGTPRDGDAIYNGALDNASGTAAMIEVARTLSSGPRLRRSVLFMAVAAEEKGLVGADYFARNPTVETARLVGVINLDGSLPFYAFDDVIGFGVGSSTLGVALERAAASLDVTVSPDPAPQQSFFTRSDHYAFVRQGTPGIFLIAGSGTGPDGRDGREIAAEWSAAHLHQPSDEADQPIDYEVLARWAELFRRFTIEAANAPERPLWYEGDYFGERFAPDAEKARR